MDIILSALALTLGLTAVWLATTAGQKIDKQGDQLLQGIRNEQRMEIDELKDRIDTIHTKSDRMLDRINSSNSDQKS